MIKNHKVTERKHINYSENEEAIGDFVNGKLINGYYKVKTKEEDEYLVEFRDGEIFSKVGIGGDYNIEIRNTKQFEEVINGEKYSKVSEICFHKTSCPSIFGSSFSQLSQYIFCNLVFIEFLPTPEYNKFFLALIENLEKGAYLKRDFALMPSLYFQDVKLSSEKDISLLNEFLITFLKDIYLECPHTSESSGCVKDEGDFSLSVNDNLIFESHKFNQKFDFKKLEKISSNENKNYMSDFSAFIKSYINELDFSKSLMDVKKTTDLINIKFEVLEQGISWNYNQDDFGISLEQEWKKILNELIYGQS